MNNDKAEKAKNKDFVEIKFTGYANEEIFDSNIEEDLKKINPEAKTRKLVIVIGEGMVVPGFDKALDGKEINRDYEVRVGVNEGFGARKSGLVKIIPLRVFHEQRIEPRPGMILSLDGAIVKIITVSGARVVTDFNNPLAGKELLYKFKIIRKVEDERERAWALFEFYIRFIPEFEISEKIIVKGPRVLENVVSVVKDKFKELLGKELIFEEKKNEKERAGKRDALGDKKLAQ